MITEIKIMWPAQIQTTGVIPMQLKMTFKEALEHLLVNGPHRSHSGICYNASYLMAGKEQWHKIPKSHDPFALIPQYAVDWPEHRFADRTPVPQYCNPVDDIECYGPWQGKNLALRHSLIRHILKKLDEENPNG